MKCAQERKVSMEIPQGFQKPLPTLYIEAPRYSISGVQTDTRFPYTLRYLLDKKPFEVPGAGLQRTESWSTRKLTKVDRGV